MIGLALVVAVVASSCVVDLGVAGGAFGVSAAGVVVGGRAAGTDANGFTTYVAFTRSPNAAAVDLAALPGDANATAFGINATGTVVGTSSAGSLEPFAGPDPGAHAVRWDPAGPVDLGDLGGHRSEARAVNRSGVIVGNSYDTGSVNHAVVFHPAGPPTALADLPGASGVNLWGLNDRGEAVGYERAGVPSTNHAVKWDVATGAVVDLGARGAAYGISNDGTIVGSIVPDGATHAHLALWAPGSTTPIDLGDRDGHATYGLAVNDHHVVVGYALRSSRPFNAIGFDPAVGHITDLGTLDDTSMSVAFAINEAGTTVGISNGRAVRFLPDRAVPTPS